MRLPEGLEWACPAGSDVWGIREVDAAQMLCGDSLFARYGAPYCPAVQPVNPSPQCGRCLAKLREMA
jgi:hypothetical protein